MFLLNKGSLNAATFIIPQNDGEAYGIFDLLTSVGAPDIRRSQQPWGARLDLEPASTFIDLKPTVVIVEMPSPHKEEELKKLNHSVIIIDHHSYGDLDRNHSLCSLEQMAQLLGVSLTPWLQTLAINDRSYIYGLRQAGYSLETIKKVRTYDLECQGMTPTLMRLSDKAYKEKQVIGDFTVCFLPSLKSSYLVDLHVFDTSDRVEDILIFCYEGKNYLKVKFSGKPENAEQLYNHFKNRDGVIQWYGGGGPARFWGTSTVNVVEILDVLGIKYLAIKWPFVT
ncbi:MAG: Membrane protein [uncultured bacterium]|nr:MAG: Membrane protein [uncultured bacterium]OFW69580.1 MAG: hypothetical protein A2X70_01015 [Alphaproteobacteria bacterium GWC2_42_16]OFW74104.1 MAG: hypothetical protein A2Z80_04680 [Alphaproteobacteria bacterium GWA2_41_27]OFW84412.1 MAG: hypothetical protein A3E50_03365 [Alphaproteobacteria bacterium RIFCSPHIGHO2_12_FULL_42_100]OFW85933.1 MAG: hypothetical protein A2W06_05245 [Alphaproteobacteria bacterium RBG_16_42_14]OFW92259.1 MAG: hypothetical protein A3C41_02995 [Alphaproteobacteri